MKHFAAAIASMTLASALHAEVVMFDNSNATFVWVANGGPSIPSTRFDPTLAPENQPAFDPGRSLNYGAFLGSGSNTVASDSITHGAQIQLVRSGTPVIVEGPQPGQQTTFVPAAAFAPQSVVGPSENFSADAAIVGYFNPGLGRHNFLGEHTFMGFRVMLGDGQPHFGWVELDYRLGRTANDIEILMYQPIRWAFETLPNTPITVPSIPGAALLLAGAAVMGRRRGA